MTLRKSLCTLCWIALPLLLGLTVAACGDDDAGCTDPCEVVGDLRCHGSVLQQCWSAADGCVIWGDQQDCAAQGLVCLSPITGPTCGMLCTDPCSTGMSRCAVEVWQTCEADQWGCMHWEDYQDCAATSLVCDDATGDASCFDP
jgi:hypothetical protein